MPPKGKKKGQSLPGESSDDDMPINKKQQNNNNKKGGKGKFQDLSDEEDIPQPVKKGGKQQQPQQPSNKGGKKQVESDEEDIPQPVKKGQQPSKGAKGKKQESDEEVELPQPVKKGGKQAQQPTKGGKSPKVESDEEEDIPQPVKKGQQPSKGAKGKKQESDEEEEIPQPVKKGQQPSKGAKGKKQESDEEEDIPQPVKKGQQPSKGAKGKKQESDEEEDIPQPVKKGGKQQPSKGKKLESEDEEEDIPQPVKKGGKQQPTKGGKKQVIESESEEEDIPQPVKKGGKQQPSKGSKRPVESEDEEVEDIPQPVKKGGKQQPSKGAKGKKLESDEEEEEIPQPVKKGGKQQPTKGAKGKKLESEDEEEEDIPQPVKKGGKQQPSKGSKRPVESEDEEEVEDIPQPVKKGGKQQPSKGAKGKKVESEDEEVEDIPQPVKKGGKQQSSKSSKKVESEDEEMEDIPQPVSKKDKKKSSKKEEEVSKSLSKLSIKEEAKEEEEEEETTKKSSKKDKKRSSKSSKSSKSKQVEEEEEEEEVEEEEEKEDEPEKVLTLAERKALKEAKKKQKLEKKLEKKLKSRYQEEEDFESLKLKNKVEIDYDNVDIDDVPGIDPPAHVHLKSGQDLRSKIGNDIKFDNLTLQVPGKTLLENASLTLAYGQKYGFVGRNGIGKSTLVKKIAIRDEITIAPHLRVLYVEQEVQGTDETPLEIVLNADEERSWLVKEEKVLVELEKADPNWQFNPREKRNYTLRDIYDRLREIESDRATIRATSILNGLGFSKEEVTVKKSKEYSGGWRMRIALARALFCKPEILLLDEPSNHLDLHACVWLEKYLQSWDRTLVVVSHEATFLNEVVDNIIHIHDKKLSQYKGNYDAFQKQRAVNIRTQESSKGKQDVKIKKLKEFVAKNKNNKNAATAAKKNKELQEMNIVRVEREDPSLVVDFPEPEHLTPPLLKFDNVSFGYEGQKEMFKRLFCGVDMDSKIALVGMNGVGKSTLMKLMSGELHETSGYIERSRKCRVARFSQHFVDQLDTDVSPIEYFQKKFNNPPVQQIRNHLGRFGISQTLPTHKITTLSGGQKSRVILAELAWSEPHILLLDEPTNHLDIDAIEALAQGINEYKGGVVLISHNQHLINLIAERIWVVKKDGTVSLYDGDFMDYKEEISREIDKMIITS